MFLLPLILFIGQNVQVARQLGQGCADVVGQGGDEAGVGSYGLPLALQPGQHGQAQALDVLPQGAEFVPALHPDGVVQIPRHQKPGLPGQRPDSTHQPDDAGDHHGAENQQGQQQSRETPHSLVALDHRAVGHEEYAVGTLDLMQLCQELHRVVGRRGGGEAHHGRIGKVIAGIVREAGGLHGFHRELHHRGRAHHDGIDALAHGLQPALPVIHDLLYREIVFRHIVLIRLDEGCVPAEPERGEPLAVQEPGRDHAVQQIKDGEGQDQPQHRHAHQLGSQAGETALLIQRDTPFPIRS